jgi:hypothetical protein
MEGKTSRHFIGSGNLRRVVMKLWSKGLGRTEITMDFRYYEVIKDAKTGEVVVVGNMQDPVTWDFTMRMEPNDIAGILKIMFSWSLIWFVIKNLFSYPLYLLNRKKFAPKDGESLGGRVMTSYETVMAQKSRKKRVSKRQSASPLGKTPEIQAA